MVIIRYVYSILTLILLLGSVSALASDLPPESIINTCARYVDDDPDLLGRVVLESAPTISIDDGDVEIFSFIRPQIDEYSHTYDRFWKITFERFGLMFFAQTKYGIKIMEPHRPMYTTYAIIYGDQTYPLAEASLIGISATNYQKTLKHKALRFESPDVWLLLTAKNKQQYLCTLQFPWEKAPDGVRYILSLSTKKRQLFYVEREDHLSYD